MFGRIGYTWQMMGASWQVLKKDKELILFSLLSSICCIIVLVSFALPIMGSEALTENFENTSDVVVYGILFLFYFCNYFVITFFNAAIIACAVKRIGGGDPTLSDGFGYAIQCLPQVFGWAIVAATVGTVLRIIEDKSEKIGAIVAGLLGMAWTVITFLVLPILVVEKVGPIAAVKKSAQLLKQTWGAQLGAGFGFGLVFFLLGLLGAVPVILGILAGGTVMFVLIGVAVVYWIVLSLVQSTLHAIFQAVLYAYVETGVVAEGFDEGSLRGAMYAKS